MHILIRCEGQKAELSWRIKRAQSQTGQGSLGLGTLEYSTGTARTAEQRAHTSPSKNTLQEWSICIWNNPHCNLQTRSHWPIYTVIKLLVLNKSNYTTAYLLQLKHSNPACSRLLKVCLNIYWANRTETFYFYRHLATVPNPTTL